MTEELVIAYERQDDKILADKIIHFCREKPDNKVRLENAPVHIVERLRKQCIHAFLDVAVVISSTSTVLRATCSLRKSSEVIRDLIDRVKIVLN
jgi:hypothetical protein